MSFEKSSTKTADNTARPQEAEVWTEVHAFVQTVYPARGMGGLPFMPRSIRIEIIACIQMELGLGFQTRFANL